MKFTLEYSDNSELAEKLKIIASRIGYVMTSAAPPRMTVRELAEHVKRPVSTVSRSLRRPTCPPFEHRAGKRRILWLEINPQLLSFLTNPDTGGRPAGRV